MFPLCIIATCLNVLRSDGFLSSLFSSPFMFLPAGQYRQYTNPKSWMTCNVIWFPNPEHWSLLVIHFLNSMQTSATLPASHYGNSCQISKMPTMVFSLKISLLLIINHSWNFMWPKYNISTGSLVTNWNLWPSNFEDSWQCSHFEIVVTATQTIPEILWDHSIIFFTGSVVVLTEICDHSILKITDLVFILKFFLLLLDKGVG